MLPARLPLLLLCLRWLVVRLLMRLLMPWRHMQLLALSMRLSLTSSRSRHGGGFWLRLLDGSLLHSLRRVLKELWAVHLIRLDDKGLGLVVMGCQPLKIVLAFTSLKCPLPLRGRGQHK